MLMPASRNDSGPVAGVFRDGEVSINHRIPITTGKCYPGVDLHRAIDSHAMLFRGTPEVELYHALVHLVAAAKNFIQWIGGNCADVRQSRLEEGIGGRRVGGAKLSDLVVKKADRGGEMLGRAFTFDVHEEQSGVIKKEMVVQSGNAQAAFQGHEHRKINFIL
jgi:hypothetical protein